MAAAPEDLTGLLLDWQAGDGDALERLTPLVYQGLKRLAGKRLQGERPGHTLQPTALVHEAYMRLVDLRHVEWQDRSHFFAIAAQAMRRLLVDHARKHRSAKRGGADRKLSLDEVGELSATRAPDLVALDDALTSLAEIDPTKASIVELRFFGGLSNQETAKVVGCSRSTVVRHWRMAKAWLHSELSNREDPDA